MRSRSSADFADYTDFRRESRSKAFGHNILDASAPLFGVRRQCEVATAVNFSHVVAAKAPTAGGPRRGIRAGVVESAHAKLGHNAKSHRLDSATQTVIQGAPQTNWTPQTSDNRAFAEWSSMAKVFLSYNRQSEEIARMLVKDIEELGHSVWFDNELSGGQVWWNQILGQIRECALFVFVLSPEGLESEACKAEYTYAFDLGKPVLPVLVSKEVSINLLPQVLSEIEYVDYINRDLNAALRLARAIGGITFAGPLPDPLPNEPDTPVSYLGSLKEKVESRADLTFQEQSALVVDLTVAVRDVKNLTDGLKLLEMLRRRRDLLAIVRDEIDQVLVSEGGRSATRHKDEPAPALSGQLPVPLDPDSDKTTLLYVPSERRDSPGRRGTLTLTNRFRGAVALTGAGVVAGLATDLLWYFQIGYVSGNMLIIPILVYGFGGAIAGAISGLDSRRMIAALIGMGVGVSLIACGLGLRVNNNLFFRFVLLGAVGSVLGVLAGVAVETTQAVTRRRRQLLQPGAIDITVPNGLDTKEGFTVILDGTEMKTIRGTRYQILRVSAGRHQIEVTGVVDDIKTDTSELVEVIPGEVVKATLILPVRTRVEP